MTPVEIAKKIEETLVSEDFKFGGRSEAIMTLVKQERPEDVRAALDMMVEYWQAEVDFLSTLDP